MVQGNRSLKKLARKIQSARGISYTDALGIAQLEQMGAVNVSRVKHDITRVVGVTDEVYAVLSDEFKTLLDSWIPVLNALPNFSELLSWKLVPAYKSNVSETEELNLVLTDGINHEEDLLVYAYDSAQYAKFKSSAFDVRFHDFEHGNTITPDDAAYVVVVHNITGEYIFEVVKDGEVVSPILQSIVELNHKMAEAEAKELLSDYQATVKAVTPNNQGIAEQWEGVFKSLKEIPLCNWQMHEENGVLQITSAGVFEGELNVIRVQALTGDYYDELNRSVEMGGNNADIDFSHGLAITPDETKYIALAYSEVDYIIRPFDPAHVAEDVSSMIEEL